MEDESHLDPGWHHPSSLANPCMRYLQFKFCGIPITNTKGPNMAFMSIVGAAIHKIVERKMASHERVFAIEQSAEDPVTRVRGSNDLRMLDYDDMPAVLDIKTVERMPTEPRPKDVIQGAWYCYLHGFARFVVQYIGRGYGNKKRFTIAWADMRAVWEESRDRAVAVTDMTMMGELAPMTPLKRADCADCELRALCDRTERGDTEWLLHREKVLSVMAQTPPSGVSP